MSQPLKLNSNDSRTFMEKITDEIGQSLSAGLLGIAFANFALDVDVSMNIKFVGMSVPVWAALGLTITAADALAYASHDFIIEKIPAIQQYANIENRIGAPVLTGIASYGLLATTVSKDVSMLNSFLMGGASSLVGRYGYDTIMNKM